MKRYDYIIAGSGCAGLSLLVRLLTSKQFDDKEILLIDRGPKTTPDRTWCFWEKNPGFFEEIVYKKWKLIDFHSADFSQQYNIAPYEYKMIRGIDFYEYCFKIITSFKNVTIEYGTIEDMSGEPGDTWIKVKGIKIYANYIFNSILFEKPQIGKKEFFLLQHFKGWVVETDQPIFNIQSATFMDFKVDQQHGTTFVYLMPLSSTRALIEFTLFTSSLLNHEQYDVELKNYISTTFPAIKYKIEEEEFGVIPMTNHNFPSHIGNIINIGTAGGWTKPSTGYTFQFIQKHTTAIFNALKEDVSLIKLQRSSLKFLYYDSVFLNVLASGKVKGDKIFTQLFKKNTPQDIFKFLDNESSFLEDLRIISSLPLLPFLKAGIQQI